MIRSAEAKDYWRAVYRRNYDYSIENVNLDGSVGINKIEFNNGIFALCGLNGAGKSTIITSLKDVLGLKINEHEFNKISGKNVEASIIYKGTKINIKNSNNSRLLDIIKESNLIHYIDYKQATDTLEYLAQENLDELVEQYEQNILGPEQVEELEYLVGKEYEECIITEIEDDDKTIPYFLVKSGGISYDSLSMGIGEHFLFYIFWVFQKITNSGIVLIEEPETFISINSQYNLMNYIAKKSSKYGINIIISSHSPHIIQSIKKENICILSRYGKHVSIIRPNVDSDSLLSLGLELPKKGIIFVEDFVAEAFLKIIIAKSCPHLLKEYEIERVNGEDKITQRLQFPHSNKFAYKIIGIYDGDMLNKIDKEKQNINWAYTFLPTASAIEIEFRNCVRKNIDTLVDLLNVEKNRVIKILASISGKDYHDWLIEFAQLLGVELINLIENLFKIWLTDEANKEKLNLFADELQKICE